MNKTKTKTKNVYCHPSEQQFQGAKIINRRKLYFSKMQIFLMIKEPLEIQYSLCLGDNKVAIVLIASKQLFYYTEQNFIWRQCRFFLMINKKNSYRTLNLT